MTDQTQPVAEALTAAERYWRNGLPFTREGQLEHSRQHRDEPSEHDLVGHCRVAARIVFIERAVYDAARSQPIADTTAPRRVEKRTRTRPGGVGTPIPADTTAPRALEEAAAAVIRLATHSYSCAAVGVIPPTGPKPCSCGRDAAVDELRRAIGAAGEGRDSAAWADVVRDVAAWREEHPDLPWAPLSAHVDRLGRDSARDGGLDAAVAAVEAALPEYGTWLISKENYATPDARYNAEAWDDSVGQEKWQALATYGPTPVEALRALAARLSPDTRQEDGT